MNSWPKFSKDEIDAGMKVLASANVKYWTGNNCKKFEKEFAKFADSKYAIALANGTVAIDLALKALNIGDGDEVIVTSRSFIASVSSIVNSGAKPIFVDVCENSQNIRSSNIKKKITKKTKAILCVHLAGYPCEMETILKLASRNNLFIIEDCAQAHGAKYRGKSVGCFGDIGCWSFCQDKIMTTGGEGGMVTTNNKKLWHKMWSYKDHGKSYRAVKNAKKNNKTFNWVHNSFGTNWRMLEIQAAIGLIQLKKMKEWNKLRNLNQNKIWKSCKKLGALRVPKFNEKEWKYYHPGNIHAAYKCYVFVEPKRLKKGWNRDKILKKINENVPCFSGSCSEIYMEKAFENSQLKPKKRLKVAKRLGETSLMFLIHPTLSKKETDLTCATIEKVMKLASKKEYLQ